MERELLVRFLLCETTEQEEQKVLDWLDASPENVRMLESLDNSFSASVLNAPRYNKIKKAGRAAGALRFLGYAASFVAVLLGLGLSFWFGTKSVEQPQAQMVTVSTPKGQRTNLTLQDGTRVCLNGGSTIIYPTIFDSQSRRVKLTGEAMFDVISDKEHPFYVETYAATAKVTGTNFCVLADSGRGVFSTTLFRGNVSLQINDGSYSMTPGQTAILSGGKLTVTEDTDEDDFLWTEGVIAVNDSSFRRIAEKVESAFGVKIRCQAKLEPQIFLRGKIRISDGLDHAMSMILMQTGRTYRIDTDTNTIYIQ